MPNFERKFWDIYASSYALIAKNYIPYQEVLSDVVNQIEKHRSIGDEIVLDSGCGTGDYAKALSKRGFKIIGIDLSSAMLNKAKRNTKGPLFLRGNLTDALPLKNDSISQVVSINSLYVLGSPFKLLKEWARVLKPEGYLHLVNFVEPLNLVSMNREYLSRYGIAKYSKMVITQFFNGLCGLFIQKKMTRGDYFYWSEQRHIQEISNAGFQALSCKRTYICDYDVYIVARKMASPTNIQGEPEHL